MLKEIHEQPDAVAETIGERAARESGIDLGDLGSIDDEFLRTLRRIVIVACGTSYHAGLIGRYAIEEWSRLPVDVEIASEYRYRNPVVGADDLVIGISQSGETADTLAAMRTARERGASVLAVTNIVGSQATRDADAVLFIRAGLEVSVAATKTFVAQVAAMYLLALRMAELRGTLRGHATYAVVKNTLTELAAKEAGVTAFDGQLVGPTAIAFVTGDPVEAAKGLRDFAKTHPLLVIKGGVLDGKAMSAAAVRTLGQISTEFARDTADISDRENLQCHWIEIEKVPEIWQRLAAVGLHGRQTGMDNVRGVCGCPAAGVTPHELFDARPAARAVE